MPAYQYMCAIHCLVIYASHFTSGQDQFRPYGIKADICVCRPHTLTQLRTDNCGGFWSVY